MKTTIAKLSRAEVARRLSNLSVDPWKNLSGYIAGCHVNAWASGARKRIDRISICAIPKMGGNLVAAFRLAKEVKTKTGLTIHWHGSNLMSGGVL